MEVVSIALGTNDLVLVMDVSQEQNFDSHSFRPSIYGFHHVD